MCKRESYDRRVVLRRSLFLSVGMFFAGFLAVAQDGANVFTYQEAKPSIGYRQFYKTVQEHLKYPALAKEWGTAGVVYVKFKVDTDGKITDMKTVDFMDPTPDILLHKEDLELAARKAVMATSGEWEPAKMGGKEIASWLELPVDFKLVPYNTLSGHVM